MLSQCAPQAAENVHPVLALELTVTVSGKPHCTGVYANRHWHYGNKNGFKTVHCRGTLSTLYIRSLDSTVPDIGMLRAVCRTGRPQSGLLAR